MVGFLDRVTSDYLAVIKDVPGGRLSGVHEAPGPSPDHPALAVALALAITLHQPQPPGPSPSPNPPAPAPTPAVFDLQGVDFK